MFEIKVVQNKTVISIKFSLSEKTKKRFSDDILFIENIGETNTIEKLKNGKSLLVFEQINDSNAKQIFKNKKLVKTFYGILIKDFNPKSIAQIQLFSRIKLEFPVLKILFFIHNKTMHNIIQDVLNIGFDGLDVDSEFQEKEVIKLLERINFMNGNKINNEDAKRFRKLRNNIDKLDDELLLILANREKIVRKLAGIKKRNGMKILQLNRWTDIVKASIRHSKKYGVDKNLIQQILQSIHIDAIKTQHKIYKNK